MQYQLKNHVVSLHVVNRGDDPTPIFKVLCKGWLGKLYLVKLALIRYKSTANWKMSARCENLSILCS